MSFLSCPLHDGSRHPCEHSDDAKNDVGDGIKEASTGDTLREVGDVGEGEVAGRLEVESNQIFIVLWCERGRHRRGDYM